MGEIKLQIQPLSLQMFISLGPKYHDTYRILPPDGSSTLSSLLVEIFKFWVCYCLIQPTFIGHMFYARIMINL